jgi:hypothetical protein
MFQVEDERVSLAKREREHDHDGGDDGDVRVVEDRSAKRRRC